MDEVSRESVCDFDRARLDWPCLVFSTPIRWRLHADHGQKREPAKVALICAARVAVAQFEGEIATPLTGFPRRGRSTRLKPAEQKGTIFNEHEKMLLL